MLSNRSNLPALSRRNFLTTSATAVAASALLSRSTSTTHAAEAATAAVAPKKLIPIGLELYSVRGELAKDLPNTLRTVAKQGYNLVEFYAPYFQWTFPRAKEVRALLDDLGMKCWSTHNSGPGSINGGETMARAIELNQILGSKILVQASPPPGTQGLEGWKRACERFSVAVAALTEHGLTAGYHNHATEWAKIDGEQRIIDVLAANTPKEFVLQLDVGTCVAAGADPVAWIKANPGRIRSVHLKDWAPGDTTEEKGYRVLFGEGVSPWKEIVAAAEEVGGVEYFLMEQEGSRYSEFETAERCLATWRKLRAS
jgi:sugar phosphate isomerase/epimerase